MKFKSLSSAVLILILLLLAGACSRAGGTESTLDGKERELSYARNLRLVDHEGFTEAILANPWKEGSVLHHYILVPDSIDLPDNLPEGTVVRTPLKRAVVGTASHCRLIEELGASGAIAGVCEPEYIDLPFVKQGLAKGTMTDCGSGKTPTIEKIIDLHPDAVLLSVFQNSGSYGRLGKLDIPIIELADYMESGPLARAEWIKFYGMLFGKESEANEIFRKSSEEYMALKEKAAASGDAPTVLPNKAMGATWYVPEGDSSIGQILRDANISYPWSGTKGNGSTPLSFESVLEKGGDADVWFFTYNDSKPLTYSRLLTENGKYSQFKPFREKKIWAGNSANNHYFEDTPFHPERLLRDIILITRPGLTEGTPVYFQPLQE